MRTASFFSFDMTPVNRIVFEGPYTEAVQLSTRRFYTHVVFNTPYHQYAGINIYYRFLDVYSVYTAHSTLAEGPSSVVFTRAHIDHPFKFIFHQNSNFTEIIDCYMCAPTRFGPHHDDVYVTVKHIFRTNLLSYNLGSVIFTGPIDLSIDSIVLPRQVGSTHSPHQPLLHFHQLDNDLGSVRAFELRDSSVMKFSTGQGQVTFDGRARLAGNADIVGIGDNIVFKSLLSEDLFEWSGGGFTGNIVVNIYNNISVESQSDKRIRQEASVIAHSELYWAGSGFMNGFDNSSLVVSPTGQLIVTTNANFGCRTSDSSIDHPCVCDAELVNDGILSFEFPHMNSRFCWGIQNNGVINHHSFNLWAFSYLSGNGDFYLRSDARILFASSTQYSILGPNSKVSGSGKIDLLYDTTVLVVGFFSSSSQVTVQEGTLIFDDDAFLDLPFDLTVIIGKTIFNNVLQMITLANVRAIQGSVFFNTGRRVNITNLDLDEFGWVHGPDHVYIENSLDWQGGGFGENTTVVILNEAKASENNYLKSMMANSHIINHGKFEFNGPTDLEGTDSYFTNERDGTLLIDGTVFWTTGSASKFNYLHNYGVCEVVADKFVTHFIFEHYPSGIVDLSMGELMFAAGGFSLGHVHCHPGTRIGVDYGEFVFRSSNNSFIDGNSFFFLIRNPDGVIRVETLFSLETMYNSRLWDFLCFR
ncbi:hypothetical protein GEMRC1_010881 [Eukaryota sp. GEM-RC1]